MDIKEKINHRQKANCDILDALKMFVLENKELRFHQILHITKLIEEGKDKFYDESIDTLQKLNTFFINENKQLDINIDCRRDMAYPSDLVDGCENCEDRNFHMVSHPGGDNIRQVESYYCEKGYWEDNF